MIALYYSPTPNGRKISIALEEFGLPYEVTEVDTLAGDQFKPAFVAINPNAKMPAIVDPEGPDGMPISVWESGAILLYLAEKHGKFLPDTQRGRIESLKWLMFQMAGIGPMGGQFAFFAFYAREKLPFAIERYFNEVNRILGVMDRRVAETPFFAGDDYTVVDMAMFPWWEALKQASSEPRPALEAWAGKVGERPAVQRGMALLDNRQREETIARGMLSPMNDDTYDILYGRKGEAACLTR
jgi:GSH-dependent disulfide-bond oxidoreductase